MLEITADKLMPSESHAKLGLLIDLNCIKVIRPKANVPGNDKEHFVKKTELGWGNTGRVGVGKVPDDVTVHRTVA